MASCGGANSGNNSRHDENFNEQEIKAKLGELENC